MTNLNDADRKLLVQAVNDLELAIYGDQQNQEIADVQKRAGLANQPTVRDIRNQAHNSLNELRKILGMPKRPMNE